MDRPTGVSAPLKGVRVVDLTRLVPGPYATLLLRGLGAEVIKIEEPRSGDPLRATPPPELFEWLNRGKKSVALDLKSESGREVVLKLVTRADVLVEGFRPGVMERLKIDYPHLSSVNPRLVYCAITGYGQSGPLSQAPGHDLNYLGHSGILDATGSIGGAPVIPAVPIADMSAGLVAVIRILAALRTGRGEFLDVSMLGALQSISVVPASLAAAGMLPPRGQLPLTGGLACYNAYETSDGKFVTLAALEPHFWTKLCDVIKPKQQDQDGLRAELVAAFKTRTQKQWLELAAQHDLPIGPVEPLPAAEPRSPFLIAERAPTLGEHTESIVRSLGNA